MTEHFDGGARGIENGRPNSEDRTVIARGTENVRSNREKPQRAGQEQRESRRVNVIVTNEITGVVRLVPYSKDRGRLRGVEYEVPLYKMILKGTDNKGAEISEIFDAVRFGIEDRGRGKHAVVGLKDAQTHTLKWCGYMNGSWQLYGDHLIHKGADNVDNAWGAIGCIEVTGPGKWARFNELVKELSGSKDRRKITRDRNFTATFERAEKPPLKRR